MQSQRRKSSVSNAAPDSSASTRILLNSIGIGLVLFDRSARITYQNSAARALIKSRPWLSVRDKRLRYDTGDCIPLEQTILAAAGTDNEPRSSLLLRCPPCQDSLTKGPLALSLSVIRPSVVVGALIDPLQHRNPDVSALQELYSLTDGEIRITALIAAGLDYKEIATQRGITVATVRAHTKSIFKKLGVDCRAGVVHKAHATMAPLSLLPGLQG